MKKIAISFFTVTLILFGLGIANNVFNTLGFDDLEDPEYVRLGFDDLEDPEYVRL